MACLVTLSLCHPVADLENPSHPSHRPWKKSLQILRDIRHDECNAYEISGCHVCVYEEHPNEVVFMYPHLDQEDFKTLQASLASTDTDPSSPLRDALTSLVKEPPSTASAVRLSSDLHLAYPRGPKCFEFLTARYPEDQTQRRHLTLGYILDPHLTNCPPCTFVNPPPPPDMKPVMSFSNASPDEGKTQFWCIEWRSLQDHHALFQSSEMRTVLQNTFRDDRARVLEALGKSDADLTWEENFRVYFRSTGASEVQSRFLLGTMVTDEYLGLNKGEKGNTGCRCIIL